MMKALATGLFLLEPETNKFQDKEIKACATLTTDIFCAHF